MFHYQGKKSRPMHAKPLHDLTAIASPKALLAENKRSILLEKIATSCGLDTSRFDNLGLTLIHEFANQCQQLPETSLNFYALPGGVLDHALHRTEAAVHLLRQQIVPARSERLSEEQQLWMYALFSASMMQGIGKLQLDYRIELFDVNGLFSRLWNPLLEQLGTHAKYYYHEFTHTKDDDLRRRLNLLLAYQLMPHSGFTWIAEHPLVLAAWLALLNEDPYAAGMLGLILERAEAIALQRGINELLIRHASTHTGRPHRINTFIDTAPESSVNKEHILGAEFIKWLTHELEKGRFSINKLPIVMIPAGLVITIETYHFFMKDHPGVKHWQAVHKAVMALGLHHDNDMHYAQESDNNLSKEGLVLKKFSVILPDEVPLYDPSTGKEKTVSALELMHSQQSPTPSEPMPQLTQSGAWLAVEGEATKLQSGYVKRE